MKKLFLLFLATVLLTVGAGMIQAGNPTAKSRNIVAVERNKQNAPQSLYVNIDVDHKNRIYKEGDLMKVSVTANKSCYLYLLYKNASNEVVMLFPNKFEANNKIDGGKTLTLPTATMNFDFETQPPFGNELLQAIVTLEPVKDLQTIAFNTNAPVKSVSSNEIKAIENCILGMVATGRENKPQQQITRNDYAECTLSITTVGKTEATPVAKHKRIFVGICVANYLDKMIPALPACEKDIKAMADLMVESCGVDSKSSYIYINEDATYDKIKKLFFEILPEITKPGDEVIIYWTGHGARCADTNGDEKDGYDETLVLHDSQRTVPTTQLVDDDFGRWVQNISGRRILFILDTCHSFGMNNTSKGLDNDLVKKPWDYGFGEVTMMKDLGQSDLAVIASSAASEVSMVRIDQKMSVMTWFIVDYLKNHSNVSHKVLADNIRPLVEAYVHEVEPSIEQSVGLQDQLSSPMILNP